jgi:hypothetical protein
VKDHHFIDAPEKFVSLEMALQHRLHDTAQKLVGVCGDLQRFVGVP